MLMLAPGARSRDQVRLVETLPCIRHVVQVETLVTGHGSLWSWSLVITVSVLTAGYQLRR